MQRQGEEEEEEKWKERHNPREEERADRRTDSTIHTVPELLMDTMQVQNHSSLTSLFHTHSQCLRTVVTGKYMRCIAESRERPGGNEEGDGAAAGGVAHTGCRDSGGGEALHEFTSCSNCVHRDRKRLLEWFIYNRLYHGLGEYSFVR